MDQVGAGCFAGPGGGGSPSKRSLMGPGLLVWGSGLTGGDGVEGRVCHCSLVG